MPVPSAIADLSTTPGSNSPVGADSPNVLDDHIRTIYAFIRTLSDTKLSAIADGSISTAKIVDDAVTFAKLQNITTARMLGRTTAGSGDTEELTAAQVKTLLAYAAIASSGSASDLTTGSVPDARLPQVIGISQTIQNVTGSRALNTNYTNSTGRTITAYVAVEAGGPAAASALLDSSVVLNTNVLTNLRANFTLIVRPGGTYRVDGSTGLASWWELR